MTVEKSADTTGTAPDGRTRCHWVESRPEHHAFHDAEFGMIPDVDEYCRERVMLVCVQRDMPLVDVLDHRAQLWEAFKSYDAKHLAALDDAWIDATAARGGIFGDRERLAWWRDVAKALVATAKEWKELRDYFLAERFLTAEEQFAELTHRFPGFTKADAANLMEAMGTVEGMPHERDCWRA
jgi:DNA-3-methyladenine glycosylase I